MVLEFAASLLPRKGALAAPKLEAHVMWVTRSYKYMTINDLVRTSQLGATGACKSGENWKCRTMHIQCIPLPDPRNIKPMAGSGRHGLGSKGRSEGLAVAGDGAQLPG